jgi:cytochrome b561
MANHHRSGYGRISRWLHWSMAALILVVLALGLTVEELAKGPERTALMDWHQSLGVLVLTLAALRLLWRLANPPPRPLGGALSRRLAPLMHWSLYALMIAQPLSGWLLVQAEGHQLSLFGSLELPVLVTESETLEETLEGVHGTVWVLLVLAVLGHAAAALKHHLVDRDATLIRMLRG